MSLDALFDGLTDAQREAVGHTDGPLLVLAGAGSGKTRVITRRAAHLAATVARADQILAITFTNKAAGEMRERIAALGVGAGMWACTFHSLCARLLRTYGQWAGVRPNFTIFDTADARALIREAIDACGLNVENWQPRGMEVMIGDAKGKLLTPESFTETARDYTEKTVARIYTEYQRLLREQNGVDFDDLLMHVALLLRDHADIRAALSDRFRYLLIDEYQDTNHAQYTIASLLASAHRNICATGDPDQSIYAWRGADIRNILDFEAEYPDAKIVRLEENFRSTGLILSAASALIDRNVHRKPKRLWSGGGAGHPVRVWTCEDAVLEARAIAGDIREHLDSGGEPGDVAIFYRINALTRVVEDELRREAIPYLIVRGVEFYNRKEVKDVLAYLHILVNPADETALLRAVGTPSRGIGKTTIGRLKALAVESGATLCDAMIAVCGSVETSRRQQVEMRDEERQTGETDMDERSHRLIAGATQAGTTPPGLAGATTDHRLIALDTDAASRTDAGATIPSSLKSQASSLSKKLAPFARVLQTLRELPQRPVAPVVETVLRLSGIEGSLAAIVDTDPEPLANARELVTAARQFDEDSPEAALSDWLQQISLVSDADALDEAGGAVALMTLHTAKGLEYPIVYVIGVEENLLPHRRAIGSVSGERDEVEEERRLCFVGMTRAMRRLTLSHARYRMTRGITERTMASRFLRELPKEEIERREFENERDRSTAHLGRFNEGEDAGPGDFSYYPGQRVRHGEYGEGEVVKIEPRGRTTYIRIHFAGHGERAFALEHVELYVME